MEANKKRNNRLRECIKRLPNGIATYDILNRVIRAEKKSRSKNWRTGHTNLNDIELDRIEKFINSKLNMSNDSDNAETEYEPPPKYRKIDEKDENFMAFAAENNIGLPTTPSILTAQFKNTGKRSFDAINPINIAIQLPQIVRQIEEHYEQPTEEQVDKSIEEKTEQPIEEQPIEEHPVVEQPIEEQADKSIKEQTTIERPAEPKHKYQPILRLIDDIKDSIRFLNSVVKDINMFDLYQEKKSGKLTEEQYETIIQYK